MSRKTSEAGIALIKRHEGLRLDAYADPAHGWRVPTIGYGHTSAAGPPQVTRGMKITEVQADTILRQDLKIFERAVERLVKVPLTDGQFAALVSFAFNLGPQNLEKSTLLRRLNAGDYRGAAEEFERWNRAGGRVLPGLTHRRASERRLFEGKHPPAPSTPARPTVNPAPHHPPDSGPAGWHVIAFFIAAAVLAAFLLGA